MKTRRIQKQFCIFVWLVNIRVNVRYSSFSDQFGFGLLSLFLVGLQNHIKPCNVQYVLVFYAYIGVF